MISEVLGVSALCLVVILGIRDSRICLTVVRRIQFVFILSPAMTILAGALQMVPDEDKLGDAVGLAFTWSARGILCSAAITLLIAFFAKAESAR